MQLRKWLSDPLAIELAQRTHPDSSDELAQLARRERGDVLSSDEARTRDILINCGAGPLLICQGRAYAEGIRTWKRYADWLPNSHSSAWRDYFVAISARVVRSAIVEFGLHSFEKIYSWSDTLACRGLSVDLAECKAVALGYTVGSGTLLPTDSHSRGHRQRPSVTDPSLAVLALAHAHAARVEQLLARAFPHDEPARTYAWERMLRRATLSERSHAIASVEPGLLFLSLRRGIGDAQARSARARPAQAGPVDPTGAELSAALRSSLIRRLGAAGAQLSDQLRELSADSTGAGSPAAVDPLQPLNDAIRACEEMIAHLERGGPTWERMAEDFAALVAEPGPTSGADPRGLADRCDSAVERRATVASRTLAIAMRESEGGAT